MRCGVSLCLLIHPAKPYASIVVVQVVLEAATSARAA